MNAFTDDFQVSLDFRKLAYAGASQKDDDCWHYVGPNNVSFRLLVFADGSGARVTLYAPTYQVFNYDNGPTIKFKLDTHVGTLLLGDVRDAPEAGPERAAWFMEKFAKAQDPMEPHTLNGTVPELRQIMQDIANLARRQISVTCAHSENDHPYMSTTPQDDLMGGFIRTIVRWFHPVGTAPNSLNGGSLNMRRDLSVGRFSPEELSAHELMEIGARVKDFIETHAKELDLGPRALATRLKLLGLIA